MISNRRIQFWLLCFLSFVLFLFLIRSVLLPFVLGIFTAYFLDPLVDKFERLKLSRGISTFLVTLLFFVSIITLTVLIAPLIAGQLAGLIAATPDYVATLRHQYASNIDVWLNHLPMGQLDAMQGSLANMSSVAISFMEQFVQGIFKSGAAILNVLSLLLITPVVAFYLLRDWDALVEKADGYLPRAHAATIREQLSIIDSTLAGFIRGQLNVCLILGVYFAIALSLVGLKFGLLIGLMSGLLVIIPYVGALFGAVVSLGVAFFQFDSYEGVAVVLAVFLMGQVLEGYILTPRLVGSRVGLHPVWVIFGMLAGAALFGFVGVLLAVPVSAVIGVLIRFALSRYLNSSYYSGEASK